MSPRLSPVMRLRGSKDFQRVRRAGRSWANSLVVLVTCSNPLPLSRFGFVASKALGSAPKRNRAKRLLREAVGDAESRIATGRDVVLIARPLIVGCTASEVSAAVRELLSRANLLCEENG